MNESSHKKFYLLIIVVLLFAAGYWYFYGKETKPANGFEGNLVGVENNILTVKGMYTYDGMPADSLGRIKEVRVQITESTIIQRETFDIPAGGAAGVTFVIDDLPKTTSTITLEDMKNDAATQTLGLIIEAEENIASKKKFIATKIIYRLPRALLQQ